MLPHVWTRSDSGLPGSAMPPAAYSVYPVGNMGIMARKRLF